MFVSFEQRYKILQLRGARAAAAALVTLLAGTWFWACIVLPDRENFTLYFASAVHGLSVGAPVQIDGQTVGQVDEIRIVSVPANDVRHRYYAAVTISIDTDALDAPRGVLLKTDSQERLQELIRLGLRGQLRMPSLLANGLCVSLYFAPGQPVNYINPPDARYPEIPTNYKSTSDLVDQVNAFIETKNLYALAEEIRAVRTKEMAISAVTENIDARNANRKIIDFLEETNRALAETEFRTTLAKINLELSAFCEILEQQKNVSEVQTEELRKNLKKLSNILLEIRTHAREIRKHLSDESALPGLRQLRELRERCAPLIDIGKFVFF
ncbi:MAG: MCE family protein [Opitutales bacterium]|nr:MCE family protein [Opitutales bacterium]